MVSNFCQLHVATCAVIIATTCMLMTLQVQYTVRDNIIIGIRTLFTHREQEKKQQEKYFQQLEQMRQRVKVRPLLFEQASLTAARQSAEAKYLAALKKAGLSEEEIQALNQQNAT